MGSRKEMKSVSGALRYVGNGEYIVGVPARNLSAEEASQFASEIARTETATGKTLYVAADEAEAVEPQADNE